MTAMEQSETDKNSAVVEGLFDFEFIDPPAAQLGKELTATIKASQPIPKLFYCKQNWPQLKGKVLEFLHKPMFPYFSNTLD